MAKDNKKKAFSGHWLSHTIYKKSVNTHNLVISVFVGI